MTTIISPFGKKIFVFFLIFLTLVSSNSCNYFVVKHPEKADETLQSQKKNHNRYIIHSKNNVFDIFNLQFDKEFLTGELQKPFSPVKYTEGRSKRYKDYERDIINEVHFYVDADLTPGVIKIPLSSVSEVRVIDPDTGKTILAVLGVTAGIFVILMIIVLLTKSSCPYVYTHNGSEFTFEGETFGGAIGQNMERDDYMPLPSAISESGKYRIKITDELKERQFTDIAELIVVEHPEGTSVLLDSKGKAQLITDPAEPLTVISSNGADLKTVMAKKDNNVFMFDNQEFSKNSMVLKFKNNGANNGKLVLKGKNTLWFDYIYGEFLSMFGNYYDTWTEKQTKLSYSEKMKLALDSDIPLSVYLKVNGKWQVVENLMTVGPLASREFVIPFDLKDTNGDLIEIKLETGFMFWELDYAALDLNDNNQLKTVSYTPVSAVDLNNKSWTSELASADNKYMEQTVPGESTEIVFQATNSTATNEQLQSLFLHTQGYYTLVRDFSGSPQLTELYKFKVPGHFSDFSKQKFEKWLTEDPHFAKK